MVRIQYSKRENPNQKVNVFDEDHKKVYFHDEKDVPNYMDKKDFYKQYTPSK